MHFTPIIQKMLLIWAGAKKLLPFLSRKRIIQGKIYGVS
ncbi:hypothetical protein RT42_GL000369 [Enterococcus cecorum DSM 20682 = ATCC 43198]|nr:hypothetical protein RT42_GL000369 [Enterococcus cecorum DSM 20682 = ATCC 43198]